MSDVTSRIKASLWHRFGDKAHPAEWDGFVHGGGRLSQRFWEYHQAVEMLGLNEDSIVLDIGGGSPVTGAGFFAETIAPYVRQVRIVDVNCAQNRPVPDNILFHRELADYDFLLALLRAHPEITHVACLSVFEHIEHSTRVGIVQAINDGFQGTTFVATLEFEVKQSHPVDQVKMGALSELFAPLTNFYLEAIEKSPVQCESAYGQIVDFRWLLDLVGIRRNRIGPLHVPLWYPLALHYRRNPSP